MAMVKHRKLGVPAREAKRRHSKEMNSRSCIALITARSGSKGVPNKNLKIINGQSLLERAIRSAQDERFSSVYVSSDNEDYQKIAESLGAKYHARDEDIASDVATTSSHKFI